MRVLMIAPPGAGKGTQGALIAAHFDIPHIATGELLRDHVARRTALGRAVQACTGQVSLASMPVRSTVYPGPSYWTSAHHHHVVTYLRERAST